jgi:ATP-dependent Clp protease ATP-binding subunit ClpB
VPVVQDAGGEKDKLLRMEDSLATACRPGEAVHAVATAVPFARGLAGPEPPDGLVHVLGPTGVGKTELTKALAEYLFNDETAMVHSACPNTWRSFGVAADQKRASGYVGYDEAARSPKRCGGGRTRWCCSTRSKGASDVFNVLLQVLDDGRLTDGQGRTVDFRNTLIIMTSTSVRIPGQPAGGEDTSAVREHLMGTVRRISVPIPQPRRRDHPVPPPAEERDGPDRRNPVQPAHEAPGGRKIAIPLDAAARDWLAARAEIPPGARPLKRVISASCRIRWRR